MKKLNLFISCLSILLLIFACGKEQPQPDTAIPEQCEFDARATISTLENETGTIVVASNSNGSSFTIRPENDSIAPLYPCNLPPAFQSEGEKVVFSGELKETFPHERWIAQPFKLTAIEFGE